MIEFLRTSFESETISQGSEIANFSGPCRVVTECPLQFNRGAVFMCRLEAQDWKFNTK